MTETGLPRLSQLHAGVLGAIGAVPNIRPLELSKYREAPEPESRRAGLQVIASIREFWDNIPADHDPVALVDGALTVQVHKVTFIDPALLSFEGESEQGPVKVLQHVARLSITMLSRPHDGEAAARPIGFFIQTAAEASDGVDA